MAEDNVLIKTNKYCLKQISSAWSKQVIIYVSSDKFGEGGWHIKQKIDILTNTEYTICELIVYDWDTYLTPWQTDMSMKGRSFLGKGNELLQGIESEIVSLIKQYTNISKLYIAGYSLAGLFSLWSLYESDVFDGAVCCSGSVWYPGWTEYISEHVLNKKSNVYLSLGKREKNTKHPVMQKVEDNMKMQHQLFTQDACIDKLMLEWNEGGHFDNTIERMVNGIVWIIK